MVAVEDWVAVRGDALFRLAYLLTGHRVEAQELVEEALSRALPRWSEIVRTDDPETHLRRLLVDVLTSRRYRRRHPQPPAPEVRLGEPEDAEVEEHQRVWRACLALPLEERVAVVLCYHEHRDDTEVGDLTGVTEDVVRGRVARGLATLGSSLDTEPDTGLDTVPTASEADDD